MVICGIALSDTQIDSIQCLNFAKKLFISILNSILFHDNSIETIIQFHIFHKYSIQTIIQINFWVGDSIQKEIQFNKWGSTAIG